VTKTELKTFRTALENRQIELGNGNKRREGLAIESSADELDRIQNASNLDDAMRSLQRNSERLREVQDALRRMQSGTFGTCADCEENINPRRLAAIPWATSCIACQEAADRQLEAARGEIELPLDMAA
jgi:DnaK suppressor protein